jgi:hypothetical protein
MRQMGSSFAPRGKSNPPRLQDHNPLQGHKPPDGHPMQGFRTLQGNNSLQDHNTPQIPGLVGTLSDGIPNFDAKYREIFPERLPSQPANTQRPQSINDQGLSFGRNGGKILSADLLAPPDLSNVRFPPSAYGSTVDFNQPVPSWLITTILKKKGHFQAAKTLGWPFAEDTAAELVGLQSLAAKCQQTP